MAQCYKIARLLRWRGAASPQTASVRTSVNGLLAERSETWGSRGMPELCMVEPVVLDLNTDDLRAYREYVQRVSRGNEPSEMILNRSPAHAAVVIEALFMQSRDRVLIVTEKLNGGVYGTTLVIEAAKEFLTRSTETRIDILTECPIDQVCRPFMEALRTTAHDRVSIQQISEPILSTLRFNFAVGDGQHFRFEQDKTLTEAIVQFREPHFGGKLVNTFRSIQEARTQTAA